MNVNVKKLRLALILGFALSFIGSLCYDLIVCRKNWAEINSNIQFLETDHPIERIILSKSFPGSKINLLEKDSLILDAYEPIEFIRQSLIHKRTYNWNRPGVLWSVTITMVLTNNQKLTLRADKVKGDTTNLYFGRAHCMDKLPGYSTKLTQFLEEVTGYEGTLHE